MRKQQQLSLQCAKATALKGVEKRSIVLQCFSDLERIPEKKELDSETALKMAWKTVELESNTDCLREAIKTQFVMIELSHTVSRKKGA